MLQRAASNAYSWWWASHIRTKQSKWLEQCLLDMEEKVHGMLKLLEEEGDSFIQRADMYYKRRPELISNIEESFKAFRALADRYDLLSRELQNANHTIATVFPEQVQYAMSDDDEDCPVPPEDRPKPVIPPANAPQVPLKAPNKRLKTIISKASRQLVKKKPKKPEVIKSGLTKEEALEEIKKIQKDILSLQTVKEFVKSSYESGLAKYWGIENQITELQQRVSRLQDEFDVDTVIEDDDARALMAEAALKSCQETLAMLQEKQEKSSREAQEEYGRIESACQRLQSLRQKYLPDGGGGEGEDRKTETLSGDNDIPDLIREVKGIEIYSQESISQGSLDLSSVENLTVTQLAEKIDQLVNKVIGLETVVSSQTVLVNTLKTETDDLNDQMRDLEEEKGNMIVDTKNLGERVKEMEGKLNKIQYLNKNVESQNSNLQTNFNEARLNVECLSGKLSNVKPDEENPPDQEIDGDKETLSTEDSEDEKEVHVDEVQIPDQPVTSQGGEVNNDPAIKPDKKAKEEDTVHEENHHSYHRVTAAMEGNEDLCLQQLKTDDAGDEDLSLQQIKTDDAGDEDLSLQQIKTDDAGDEDLSWQQMLLSGTEDREKILLNEYTEILRNYKEVKKKLHDKEKTEKDSLFDTVLQIRDLKEGIEKRDKEIRNLKQRLEKDWKEKNSTDQTCMSETGNNKEEDEEGEGEGEGEIITHQPPPISKAEEKLRMDIDAILDENLDFWLRFSTEFHQIGKFKTEVQDLQEEILKIKEKRKSDGSLTSQMKSDARPIYKHLREIQRELSMWLEQSGSLKEELNRRFSSLCVLQEEITKALREGVEGEEIKFSSHQAARFQGEVLNMKQENNKVGDELGTGLELVRALQRQIDKTLRKLNHDFGISTDKSEHSDRHRVPLRSFIFGTKHEKKQKNSIFACMHPTKKNQMMRTGIRPMDQDH